MHNGGNPSPSLCCAFLTPLGKWKRSWTDEQRLLSCFFSEEMPPEQEEMLPPWEDGLRLEVRSPLLLRGIHTLQLSHTKILFSQPRHRAACIWLEYPHWVTASRYINSLFFFIASIFNLENVSTTTLLNNLVLFTECGLKDVSDDELEAFFPPLTLWSPTTSTIVVSHLDWTKNWIMAIVSLCFCNFLNYLQCLFGFSFC